MPGNEKIWKLPDFIHYYEKEMRLNVGVKALARCVENKQKTAIRAGIKIALLIGSTYVVSLS